MKRCLFEGYIIYYDLEGHGYSEQYYIEHMDAIENIDPAINGEWQIEFSEDYNKWRTILGDSVKFNFEEANKVLCQLVQYNGIYVIDERKQNKHYEEMQGMLKGQGPHFLEVARTSTAGFGSSREVEPEGTDVYKYTLKFQKLTAFRIRNIVTGELVMGDALLCPTTD